MYRFLAASLSTATCTYKSLIPIMFPNTSISINTTCYVMYCIPNQYYLLLCHVMSCATCQTRTTNYYVILMSFYVMSFPTNQTTFTTYHVPHTKPVLPSTNQPVCHVMYCIPNRYYQQTVMLCHVLQPVLPTNCYVMLCHVPHPKPILPTSCYVMLCARQTK